MDSDNADPHVLDYRAAPKGEPFGALRPITDVVLVFTFASVQLWCYASAVWYDIQILDRLGRVNVTDLSPMRIGTAFDTVAGNSIHLLIGLSVFLISGGWRNRTTRRREPVRVMLYRFRLALQNSGLGSICVFAACIGAAYKPIFSVVDSLAVVFVIASYVVAWLPLVVATRKGGDTSQGERI